MPKEKTINVKLPIEIFNELALMKAEAQCESWIDFFKKIASREVDIYFEVISIDNEDPAKHTIIFKLGDRTYIYQHGEIELFSRPLPPIARYLKRMI